MSVSRDFGSSFGTGDIQGTFSTKVTDPINLAKVQFYIDNIIIAEDAKTPSMLQFVTDDYTPGTHTLHAIGTTSDGSELRTREMTFNFINAAESQQRGLLIAEPILALVSNWVLFTKVVPTMNKGRKTGL